MQSNEVLEAVEMEDLPVGYQGLVDRLTAAGYAQKQAIMISLIVGMEYGGIFYPAAKIDSAVMAAKKRLTLRGIAEGKDYALLARTLELTEQTVRQIERDAHRARMQKKQLKMF